MFKITVIALSAAWLARTRGQPADGEWHQVHSKVRPVGRTPEERIAGVLTSKKVTFK